MFILGFTAGLVLGVLLDLIFECMERHTYETRKVNK